MPRGLYETRFLRDRTGCVKQINVCFFGHSSGSTNSVTVKLEDGRCVTPLRWFFEASDFRIGIGEKEAALKEDIDLLEWNLSYFTCSACEEKRAWRFKAAKFPLVVRWLDHKVRCQTLQERYREELGLSLSPGLLKDCGALGPVRRKTKKPAINFGLSPTGIRKRSRSVEPTQWRMSAVAKKDMPSVPNTMSKRAEPENSSSSLTGFSFGSVLGGLTSWLTPSFVQGGIAGS